MNDLDERYYALRARLDALHETWGFCTLPERGQAGRFIPEAVRARRVSLGAEVEALARARWEAVPEAERQALREWVWARTRGLPKAAMDVGSPRCSGICDKEEAEYEQ